MFNNNEKLHYKMYKAGKIWFFSAIATFSLGTGLLVGNDIQVHASDATVTAAQSNINTPSDKNNSSSNNQSVETGQKQDITETTNNNISETNANVLTNAQSSISNDNQKNSVDQSSAVDKTKQDVTTTPQTANSTDSTVTPSQTTAATVSDSNSATTQGSENSNDSDNAEKASNNNDVQVTQTTTNSNDLPDNKLENVTSDNNQVTSPQVAVDDQKNKNINLNVAAQNDNNQNGGITINPDGQFSWEMDNGASVTYYGEANGTGLLEIKSGTMSSIYNDRNFKLINNKLTNIKIDQGVSAPSDSTSLFANLPDLVNIDGLTNINTSKVTNMSSMFANDNLVESLDVSSFDTSNVTNMNNMFGFDLGPYINGGYKDPSLASHLKTISGLNHFNTSKVTDMSQMFMGLYSIEELDISSFDTQNVTDMSQMFFNDQHLGKNGDYALNFGSNFNTSKVTDMSQMFQSLYSAKALDVSSFDTSNVTSMFSMFSGFGVFPYYYNNINPELTGLNYFNTSKVTNMGHMFDGSALGKLDLSSFDTSNVTNMEGMFHYEYNLKELDLSSFDTSKVTDMHDMFNNENNGIFLDKLILGPKTILSNDVNLPDIPSGYHGWTQVDKNGNIIPGIPTFPSKELTNGESHPGIWVMLADSESVKVNYVDQKGNTLAPSTNVNGLFGDQYTTKAKDIPGYHLITQDNLSGTFSTNNPDVNYVYAPNNETATVKYVDDVTGKTISTTNLSGNFDQPIDKDGINSEIKALEAKGYLYASGLNDIPATFDFDGNVPTYTIHLNHNHSTVKSGEGIETTGTLTVHYQYDNGTKASDDVIKTVRFTRTGDKDDVTGDIIWSAWTPTSDTNVAVDSPEIKGFTPDQKQVNTTIVEGQDKEVSVMYTANQEQAHVQYVDQDGNVLDSDDMSGKFSEKSDYSTQAEIAKLEAEGYELLSDGYPAGYTFNTDDPTFTVVLKKHATIPVNPHKPVTPDKPTNPDTPNKPAQPAEKPGERVAPENNNHQASATQKAQNAETPKANALPQTGQAASTSLMSIIGAILLSIFGFLGLDGFKKRKENK